MAKKITKTTKPVKKAAKPVAKKAAPVKKAAKPAPKKVAKPAPKKAAPKKVAKPAPKPVAKKIIKPLKKETPKAGIKKVAKPIAKKQAPVPVKKTAKPVPKKVEKVTPKKTAKPVAKPTAKPIAKPAHVVVKPVKTPVPAPAPVVAPKVVSKGNAAKKIIVEKADKISSNTNTPFNDKPLEKEKPVFTSIIAKKTVIEDIGKTRYSDIELDEFRKLINEKLASAKKELENLKEALNNISGNSAADTESSYATFEDGSATQEKEHLSQMAARQRKFIGNLDSALARIENKTYGICAVTGKLIPKERLRAVPHTTVSIEAKLGKV